MDYKLINFIFGHFYLSVPVCIYQALCQHILKAFRRPFYEIFSLFLIFFQFLG